MIDFNFELNKLKKEYKTESELNKALLYVAAYRLSMAKHEVENANDFLNKAIDYVSE